MHDPGVRPLTGSPVPTPARPAVVETLPRSLYLEVTNRCDSGCQTCIRTFRTLEPPADLSLHRVRALVAGLPALDRVVLHGIGEPLLNREIFAIVAFLKGRGATVLFNSDAISLTGPRAVRLIESGLDEYRVSMDAATRETYRRVRGVDQFDRVGRNVRRLVELARERGSARPRVSLWFTASRANLEELPGFVALAARLGAPEVYVQRLVFNGLGLATRENSLHHALAERERRLVETAEAEAREAGIALRASGLTTPLASLAGDGRGHRPWAGCERPWTLAYVTANGNVLPCCISPWVARDYQALILGNAFELPLAAIWNGERYQRFRTRFESDEAPDPCRGCGRLWSL
ncbi:MAG: SPASM domain-containing protein [Candidatus Rokubacteria bacterium]|nr:SPASM domain-containing protein [Candidatus Rokubacteria bacterium]